MITALKIIPDFLKLEKVLLNGPEKKGLENNTQQLLSPFQ